MSEIAFSITIIALSMVAIIAIVCITIYNIEKLHHNAAANTKQQEKPENNLKAELSVDMANEVSQ